MLEKLRSELQSQNVTLVAVSKTKSEDQIMEVYNQGQKIFGENRVQELVPKYQALPKDIEWHIIGSLQSNKVKYIAPFVKLIHSVDSLKLAQKINDEAKKNERTIDILLQLKIANEQTKQGFEKRKMLEHFQKEEFQKLSNVRICGLMGMASFVEFDDLIRSEFKNLNKCFLQIKEEYLPNEAFNIRSMGMSGDYPLAIESGSNMVRLGSIIFGNRT